MNKKKITIKDFREAIRLLLSRIDESFCPECGGAWVSDKERKQIKLLLDGRRKVKYEK